MPTSAATSVSQIGRGNDTGEGLPPLVDHRLSPVQQLRHAVLLSFCDPLAEGLSGLGGLSETQWAGLMTWLDTSGLALYFLDRLKEIRRVEILPARVVARLEQNLADNRMRMDELFAESAKLQQGFRHAGLTYAVLKGFSLWPLSVPRPELRSQLDQDFLIAEACAGEARRILESEGYGLRAISGSTWEFKADEGRNTSLKDLYKAGWGRSVELHLEATGAVPGSPVSRLSRSERSFFRGEWMQVLSSLDVFVGQGLHVYKHVSGDLARTAHLLEFRRHVLARFDDEWFWDELREYTSADATIAIRLGVVIALITRLMGSFGPEALTRWTVDWLPAGALRWVDIYGARAVLAGIPGTKLSLLLQRELEDAGLCLVRPITRSLLPRRLPPAITAAVAGEPPRARFERWLRQIRYVAFRLRFHVVEGVRFVWAWIRWRRVRNELAR